MLKLCQIIIKKSINVYQGISPQLLATMSLGQGIKGKTNQQMIDSLQKSNVIQQKNILNAMKEIDRQWFTKEKDPYMNKPYSISGKQKMTDILTHSVVLQNLYPKLIESLRNLEKQPSLQQSLSKNQLNILDIGTGHGYLCFIITKIIQKSQYLKNLQKNNIKKINIYGTDINDKAIEQCLKIKHQKFDSLSQKRQSLNLNFQCLDIKDFFDISFERKFEIIIGGFYIQQQLSQKLIQKVLSKNNGVGIWASDAQKGQMLYKFTKNNQKIKRQIIMNTLFSQRVTKSKYDQYFHNENQKTDHEDKNQKEKELLNNIDNKQKQRIDKLRQQKKLKKEKIQQQLKLKLLQYKNKIGKVPTLQQMKKDVQINNLLIKLQKK